MLEIGAKLGSVFVTNFQLGKKQDYSRDAVNCFPVKSGYHLGNDEIVLCKLFGFKIEINYDSLWCKEGHANWLFSSQKLRGSFVRLGARLCALEVVRLLKWAPTGEMQPETLICSQYSYSLYYKNLCSWPSLCNSFCHSREVVKSCAAFSSA